MYLPNTYPILLEPHLCYNVFLIVYVGPWIALSFLFYHRSVCARDAELLDQAKNVRNKVGVPIL